LNAVHAITFDLSAPEKILLRVQVALGLAFALNFLSFKRLADLAGPRTLRQKVTSATGCLILLVAGYEWYGYTHSRILFPIYGLDTFTAFYWLLSAAMVASIVYSARLGKQPECREPSPSSGSSVSLLCD
jgi:hypothetical protein